MTEKIVKKLLKGEVVYLIDDCESDAAMKLIPTPDGKYSTIVKFKGGDEYAVANNTDIATRARLCDHEITEAEYNAY